MPNTLDLMPLPESNRKLLVWLHTGFLLIGIITVLLGQILPILSRRLHLNDFDGNRMFRTCYSTSVFEIFK